MTSQATPPWAFTREHLEFRLREEIERARRYGSHLAVIVLRVNAEDEGAPEPNETIRLLASAVRPFDIAAIWEDLEFALCLVQCDRQGAKAASERVIAALRPRTVAAGIAVYPEDGEDWRFLTDTARQRMEPI